MLCGEKREELRGDEIRSKLEQREAVEQAVRRDMGVAAGRVAPAKEPSEAADGKSLLESTTDDTRS